MEEERKLKLVTKPDNTLTQEQLDKLLPSRSNEEDIDKIANVLATRLNTKLLDGEFKRTNEKIDAQNIKIDALQNGIAQLINEFKKQSVDENNSSFKIARSSSDASIIVHSFDSHIAHVICFTHIAQCYKLVTTKGDKPSVQRARQMLIDLNLLEDTNFVGKTLTSSKTVGKKYHVSVLSEIKNRLSNPTHYDISLEISEKWRCMALIPNDEEIQASINQVFALFE